MGENNYVVVYDILRDGIGFAPVFVCVGMAAGFFFGVSILVANRKQPGPVACVAIWLAVWSAGTIFGGGNVLRQHFRCLAWARAGDFDVVEGPVVQFQPYSSARRRESFVVQGVSFSYSDASLGQGGFRYSFGADGSLRNGTPVRVSHREGRILKLEILKE